MVRASSLEKGLWFSDFTMHVCFYCINDIDSGAEGFLPSSCGKCDVCLENCLGATQKRKRGALPCYLPYCTAAVSGNGLSIVTSADGSFSRPGKRVSLSLNNASSFDRTSMAQHSFKTNQFDKHMPCPCCSEERVLMENITLAVLVCLWLFAQTRNFFLNLMMQELA